MRWQRGGNLDIGDIMSEKSRLFVKMTKNLRLDSTAIYNPGVSRSNQKILTRACEDKQCDSKHRLKPGSVVDYSPPVKELVLTPEALPWTFYMRIENYCVNKPQGGGASARDKGTLVHALLHHYKPLANMKMPQAGYRAGWTRIPLVWWWRK